MEKKKILILLPVFDLGGAEKQGFYAAKSLNNTSQYSSEIWALNKSSGNLIPLIESEGIPYKNLEISFEELNSTKSRLLVYFRMIRLLRKSNFYAIIPFTFHSNLMANFCYKLAGIKKSVWFQISLDLHIKIGRLERLVRFAKPIYASNSYYAGEQIKIRHKLPENQKVHFVPNPFELKKPQLNRSDFRKQIGVSDSDFLFTIVANFYFEKDHLTLLKAVKLLKSKGVQFKLLLAGDNKLDSPYLNNLKSYILDEELYDVVKFLGVVKDVPGLLKSIDCAMLTSSSEGSPNALIEYAAYAVPVIVSDIQPNLEIVGQNYDFQFPVGEEKVLEERMGKMITNNAEVKELMIDKSQEILQKFSVIENLNAFTSILKN
tara:strand:- start:2221 stop:3345 length:1125 start_codon:yes stop_codon:yes gene_type:complete